MSAPEHSESDLLAMAHNGDIDAQIYLGYAYDGGPFGLNEAEAKFWLAKAAYHNIDAKRYLARFYWVRNSPEALPVISELVKNEDMFGQYMLGHCYISGMSAVTVDYQMGIEFLKNAADQGHFAAQIDYEKKRIKYGWLDSLGSQMKCLWIGLRFIKFASIKGRSDVKAWT
jgi:TPR repeat protein